MNLKNRLTLVFIGFVIWAAATMVFRAVGSSLFEHSALAYWGNVTVAGIVYAAASAGLMKGLGIAQKDWLQGAVCIALPGMLGEIPILYGFHELMGNMHPETAGRYAAFLFGGYGALISFAWLMSVNANPPLVSDK
ncbi:MAG: DUF5367 family protein [Leptolyngbya sp. SIO1E4]|nr:DUF5367 family protein [Leptolyngbya sp. SIO1E4]